MKTITLRILLALSLAAAAFGCKGKSEPAAEEPTTGDETPAPAAEADPEDVHLENDHVTIDEEIQFALDSDEILPESAKILDHLATFLANHAGEVPGLRVIGHSDAQGDADYNQDLSARRAAAVVRALEERGVTVRLESEGRGETDRECTEDTAECHAQNRRVELLVLAE